MAAGETGGFENVNTHFRSSGEEDKKSMKDQDNNDSDSVASMDTRSRRQHSSFTLFDAVFVLFSMTTFFVDIATDVWVGVEYLLIPEIAWGILTLTFVVVPSIIMQVFSIRWYRADGTMGGWIYWLAHILLLGPIQRYIMVLKAGWHARKTKDPDDFDIYYHRQNDVCMLRLFESFIESAPQLLLQLYIMVSTQRATWLTGASTCFSLISLAWAIAAYTKAMRQAHNDSYKVFWPGMILQTIWRMGMVSARVIALVMFASVFKAWLFMVIGCHWLIMTLWIFTQKTDFCDTWWEERLFNCVAGMIYCFCFFNLKEGHSRWRMLVFYVVMFLENGGLVAVWYLYKEPRWYNEAVMGVVSGAFTIGLISMLLYYRYCHPKGPINPCMAVDEESSFSSESTISDKIQYDERTRPDPSTLTAKKSLKTTRPTLPRRSKTPQHSPDKYSSLCDDPMLDGQKTLDKCCKTLGVSKHGEHKVFRGCFSVQTMSPALDKSVYVKNEHIDEVQACAGSSVQEAEKCTVIQNMATLKDVQLNERNGNGGYKNNICGKSDSASPKRKIDFQNAQENTIPDPKPKSLSADARSQNISKCQTLQTKVTENDSEEFNSTKMGRGCNLHHTKYPTLERLAKETVPDKGIVKDMVTHTFSCKSKTGEEKSVENEVHPKNESDGLHDGIQLSDHIGIPQISPLPNLNSAKAMHILGSVHKVTDCNETSHHESIQGPKRPSLYSLISSAQSSPLDPANNQESCVQNKGKRQSIQRSAPVGEFWTPPRKTSLSHTSKIFHSAEDILSLDKHEKGKIENELHGTVTRQPHQKGLSQSTDMLSTIKDENEKSLSGNLAENVQNIQRDNAIVKQQSHVTAENHSTKHVGKRQSRRQSSRKDHLLLSENKENLRKVSFKETECEDKISKVKPLRKKVSRTPERLENDENFKRVREAHKSLVAIQPETVAKALSLFNEKVN